MMTCVHRGTCVRAIAGACQEVKPILYCEAQGKGRARGGPRKVTQRSFMDGGWWMGDGGIPFPDALH